MPFRLWPAVLALVALVLFPLTALAQTPAYEVWLVDQADAAKGGSKLYIFPGSAVNGSQLSGQPQVIDLEAASKAAGLAPGVRPHLLLFNAAQTHGVLAYVASGHVQVIRASDRKIVASIDVGEQAHGAVPSPDGSFILVANQNGKKLARIQSDFQREQYSYNPANDLDLKALENPNQPDNAPICPLLFSGDGKKAYVTLRGGGLFVVDAASTPMKVLKTFTKDEIAPAGCGGVAVGNRIFINSGTATTGHLYVFDTANDTLVKSINTTNTGTDAHGMVLVGDGKFLWMFNRGEGDNAVVVDTATAEVVGTFTGFGAAPDLADISPGGDRVFVSLRGPNNLTGGPAAKGATPGMVALAVQQGGRTGAQALFVPVGDQTAASPVDPHAIAVRRVAAALPRTGEPSILLVALPLALLALGAGLTLRRVGGRAG